MSLPNVRVYSVVALLHVSVSGSYVFTWIVACVTVAEVRTCATAIIWPSGRLMMCGAWIE